MTKYVAVIPTYKFNSWTGDNTEEFKGWVEPFLIPVPQGLTRVWTLYDDMVNGEIVVDGILTAEVPGSMNNRAFFELGKDVVVGPLYNDGPSLHGATAVNTRPQGWISEQLVEVPD